MFKPTATSNVPVSAQMLKMHPERHFCILPVHSQLKWRERQYSFIDLGSRIMFKVYILQTGQHYCKNDTHILL